MSSLYVVWKEYQRRAEVLAPRLGADLLFMSHVFSCRLFRPIDYFLKFLKTIHVLLNKKPKYVVFQGPPLFSALSAFFLQIGYVIDAHNAVFQSWWAKVPFSKFILKHAKCVIVHNEEIAKVAKLKFPGVSYITVRDPLENIVKNLKRKKDSYLFICSFNEDEPIDIITQVVKSNPHCKFYFTANASKLNVDQRVSLTSLENAIFTGFLPVEEYQTLLASCAAAIVLTTRGATQPSGACEALSSDTPLIVSRTSITEKLFGEWALLVENSCVEISRALARIETLSVDFSRYRDLWTQDVERSIRKLVEYL